MSAKGRPHRRDPILRTGCCSRSDGRDEPKLLDAASRANAQEPWKTDTAKLLTKSDLSPQQP